MYKNSKPTIGSQSVTIYIIHKDDTLIPQFVTSLCSENKNIKFKMKHLGSQTQWNLPKYTIDDW